MDGLYYSPIFDSIFRFFVQMPERSRGKKLSREGGKRSPEGVQKKPILFETEKVDLDAEFGQLTAALYKGKKLDDPISSPIVQPLQS